MTTRNLLSKALMIGTVVALAGCASQTPQTQVTRFHLGQPIAPGQVTVEPRDPTLARDLEFQGYARIVRAELDRLGFGIAPDLTKSELVAVTEVRRSWRPTDQTRGSSMSIGLGGGSGGGWGGGTSVGLGGSVSFPIGKQREKMDVLTQLSVQLKRRSEGTVIWEGRAETVARDNTPAAGPEAAVSRLAAALFKDFPGRSGETITVK
ncbi:MULTISPECIES: DUF4136 domain-containing protein [unclassified Sphingomonas]|uniref:DUF4136 domain-containing protein n=1 Tax=unclassified Sphingomonas TaxID=196159 RepID=UPI0006F45D05|nr:MULTISPECIES: DUF4136 domain-containing protein [unclassified Sphingomonas]KQX21607.1 hypothetical protein ASD17_06550 [Sphingomonas sp. Root1294]KQY72924.1 hypothetical protein ASD39_00535 [Sphingomonas sp. Root50]KRB88283.1 hypothetical protein ASE22_22905 [Sphingomonas sp. Root720]